MKNGGEANLWYDTIGPEYVEYAFLFARKYAAGGGSANIASVMFFGLKDHYVEGDTTNTRLFDKDCKPQKAFEDVLNIFLNFY